MTGHLNEVSLRMGDSRQLLCWDCHEPQDEAETVLVPAGPKLVTQGHFRVCRACAQKRELR
jgi:hypothetical protein